MKAVRNLLFAGAVALVVVLMIVGLNWGQATADPTDTSGPAASSQPAREIAPQEPPVKEEPAKPAPKVISLAEAVTLAEKANKGGYSVKAERTERPTIGFRVEVIGMDGARNVVELTDEGKVLTRKGNVPVSPGKKQKGG